MQRTRGILTQKRLWQIGLTLCLVFVVVWARALLWQAILQLFFGMLVALLAMPFMRRLEKHFSTAVAASLAMLGIGAVFFGAILILLPFVVEQVRQLMGMLPILYVRAGEWMQKGEEWLAQNGIVVNADLKNTILTKGQELISGIIPATIEKAGGMMDKLGKLLLAPAFAFYFLRDRKRIGGWLLLLLPVGWRDTVVRVLREMRRETTGFLRGQLMVSAAVGSLTGFGLLLIGMQSWLLLGTVMALLELLPYVGPFLGGIFVILFALQGGLSQALWALGVVIMVQQLENGMISPKLMSDATRLHPVAVLLSVMLGGMAGGMLGILLAIPLLLCARAALRVISLRAQHQEGVAEGYYPDKYEPAAPKREPERAR